MLSKLQPKLTSPKTMIKSFQQKTHYAIIMDYKGKDKDLMEYQRHIMEKISDVIPENKIQEEQKKRLERDVGIFFSNIKKINSLPSKTMSNEEYEEHYDGESIIPLIDDEINSLKTILKMQNNNLQTLLKYILDTEKTIENNLVEIQIIKNQVYKILTFSDEYFLNNEKISLNIKKIIEDIAKIILHTHEISETIIDTEILALNASINASKIQEYGDSFTVISENIKSVSEDITTKTTYGLELLEKIKTNYKEAQQFTLKSLTIEKEIKNILSDFNYNLSNIERYNYDIKHLIDIIKKHFETK